MYKILAYVLIASSVVGFGIWYVSYNNKQITQYAAQVAALKSDNIVLQETLSSNQKELDRLTDSFENITKEFNILNQQFNDFSIQNSLLKTKFDQHDLHRLALAKPKLIEEIINKSSVNALRCFEILSGSPLTEREESAKNGKEFNSECPWIYDTINGLQP